MVAAVASSWALFIGIALMMLGNGLQGSLLGIRASLEGFPTTLTGILMSGYYTGFLVGSAASGFSSFTAPAISAKSPGSLKSL